MPKLTADDMLSCSQLPALMGVSKWATPNDILQFCCKAIAGEDPRTKAGEAADWGNLLEETIVQEMVRRLGIKEYIMPDKAFQHKTLPLAASADAIATPEPGLIIEHAPDKGIFVVGANSILLEGPGVLESKLTKSIPEDELPLYRGPIQVQGVMMCTGYKWAAIGTLYNGIELRIFLFQPHQATQDSIAELAEDFERRLEHFRQTGEIDFYLPQDSKDADRVYPAANDQEIDLGEDIEILANEIIKSKGAISDLEEYVKICETKIKIRMQDFSSAKAGKFQIKWPMRHYKAQPEKITPAKEAYSVRQSTLTIKEL